MEAVAGVRPPPAGSDPDPRAERSWVVRAAPLAVLLALTATLVAYEMRGTTFWFDDWTWVLTRRGTGPRTLLEPFNDHLSLVPLAIYRVLFATFGLTHHWPYRVVALVAHLLVGTLVHTYARRRVDEHLALLAAALVLLLGSGAQDVLWTFQVGWLVPMATGLGTLLALEHHGRAADLLASALLTVTLASSGVGLAFGAGTAVLLLLTRERRSWWIVAVPVALYVVWWVSFELGHGTHWAEDLPRTPGWVALGVGGAVGGVLGLGAPAVPPAGPPAVPGLIAPLAVASVVAGVWRFTRPAVGSPRVVALAVAAAAFWVTTGIGRAYLGEPAALSSRYVYVGGVFVVLLAVEALAGVAVRAAGRVGLTVAVAAAVIANVGQFDDYGDYLRGQALQTRAVLGAIDLSRPVVRPDFVSAAMPGYPFVQLSAGAYEQAAAQLGTPAASEREIVAMPEAVRAPVDADELRMHAVALSAAVPAAEARPPAVDAVAGGVVTARGGCLDVAAGGPARDAALTVVLPPSGVSVRAVTGPTRVLARRFADAPSPVGSVGAGSRAGLRIVGDAALQPWRVRLEARRTVVCRQAG